MLIKLKADRALKSGRIARAGDVVDLPDKEAYAVVWAGDAAPPVRLRVACKEALVGTVNHVRGDYVDLPGDPRDPSRFYDASAVVPIAETSHFDGAATVSFAAGEAILVPPLLAAELVAAGGRWATKAEADALDWPEPPAESNGRTTYAEHLATVEGPTKKVSFRTATFHGLGVVAQAGEILEVPVDQADVLIRERHAEDVVQARVVHDGLIVNGVVCSAGDVVTVGKTLAEDADRFEPLDGAARRPAYKPATRFGS